jgi:hypothetical protein
MQNRDGLPSCLLQTLATSGAGFDKTPYILFATTNFLFHTAIRGERKCSLAHFANVCATKCFAMLPLTAAVTLRPMVKGVNDEGAGQRLRSFRASGD